MKINAAHILGWFEGEEGYNVLTRNLAEAIARRIPVYRTNLPRRDGESVAIAQGTRDHAASGDLANLLFAWADQMVYLDQLPGIKIPYVIWETSKLPDAWIDPLKKADRLWVPCRWARDMLVENGFPIDQIDIVPLGADVSVFNPDVRPEPEVAALPGFKFVTVGRWQYRKGTAGLLRAFDAEFGGQESVRLVLSCNNPHRSDIDIGPELKKLSLSCLDQITFLNAGVPNHRMAGVYKACDAAVFPTRSDPWGLPISEAMSCGLPVIATRFGGPADFMTPATGYMLDWSPAPCPWMPVIMADGDYGYWSEPNFGQLRKLMRHIYDHRDEACTVGIRAARHIAERWTWDHAGDAAVSALLEI